jgi:hypothetical protein
MRKKSYIDMNTIVIDLLKINKLEKETMKLNWKGTILATGADLARITSGQRREHPASLLTVLNKCNTSATV